MSEDGKVAQVAVFKDLFTGGGEMGALMRSYDWSQTQFGPVEDWPQSLRSALSICLNSRFPIAIYWGPECLLLYNDAWRPIVGDKHPWSLGRPGHEVWPEIWNNIGPEFAKVFATGEGIFHSDELLAMHRYGYTEECFFDYTFNPIQGEGGVIDGIFNVVSETTYRVLNDRRARLLREVASRTGTAKTVEDVCTTMITALRSEPTDVPFALLYLIASDGNQAHLCSSAECGTDLAIAPAVVNLHEVQTTGWPIAQVAQAAQPQVVDDLVARFGVLAGSPWPEPPQEAIVLPIITAGQARVAGVLVAVANPRRRLDENYRDFFAQVATQIATAIANARSYEEERQRAEQLAELDRAKTVFFSNVSHEFRTPLTLLLGPTEDALQEAQDGIQRDRLELIHRNALRLQKLVNTLLDFSRIEAGRIEAVYEPTDLAMLTRDLAGLFRSVIERANMRLQVYCPPLPEPVYIDREMWEKIILNLLSNAFKFTFEGDISVALQFCGDHVELEVRDTGTGIPADEISHIFDRFHRVQGARGRTYEGSGIGLSLVQELVHLHGGTITVQSVVNQGTCFTISIPTGAAHLPSDRIQATRTLTSTAMGATQYVEEALRWLPEPQNAADSWMTAAHLPQRLTAATSSAPLARILLADDNADMRDYVKRLLSQQYTVEAVRDGKAALAAIRQQKPDLVLTDVMMPELDGFGLLRELRAQPQTRELPVIMLSARAGEEARIEGLAAGADDYLVKPFSARELLARVEASLKLARLRQEAIQREQAQRQAAEEAKQTVETILSSISDGFLTLDRDWCYTYINDRYCDMVGMQREQLLGHSIWDIFPDMVGDGIYMQFHRAIDEQIIIHYEYFYPAWNRWFETHIYPSAHGLTVFLTEISGRKQAEAALRESEELKQRILDSSSDCIKVLTLEGDITYINTGGLALLEVDEPLQLLNRNWIQFWQGDSQVKAEAAIAAARTGEVAQFQGCCSTTTGTLKWWDVVITPLKNAWGQISQLVVISRDITQAKQAEEQLRASEERFRSMADHAPMMVWVTDPTGLCTYLSQSWYEFTGQTEAAGLGWGWVQACHPDDQDLVAQQCQVAHQRHGDVQLEYRVRRHDGEYRWVLDAASAWFDGNGQFKGYIGSIIDISDRKHIEEALRQREEELRVVTNALPVLISFVDANECYRFNNHEYEKWFGYTATDIYGKSLREVLGEVAYQGVRPYVEQVLAGQQVTFENQLAYKDGGTRYVNAIYVPRVNSQGVVEGFVALVHDISDRKRAELEREQLLAREQAARTEAERANRVKDEFLAIVSHELRSPLNPILGWSTILQTQKLDPAKTAQALSTISRNAKLQAELIEDLLDISRILRGKLSLSVAPTDLTSIIHAAMETVHLAAAAKSIAIHTRLADVGLVAGDSSRLQQVVCNLLSNAIKFTPDGGRVDIELEQVEGPAVAREPARSCPYAQITVTDTGKGIHPDFLPHVFEYFRQEDGATTRKFGGLGLGLAIVHHLVELHGGTIQAASPGEGQGATFTVRLPLMPTSLEANPAGRRFDLALDLSTIQVLVVDDDDDTREFVTFLIQQYGGTVTSVASAAEALVALSHSKPDVLLSDIGMPDADGYMLMRQVRALPPEQGGQTPAIALTAYAAEIDYKQAMAAGFQKHIPKPVEPHALVRAIVSLARAAT